MKMKLTLLFLLILTAPAAAQSAQAVFDEANALYENGELSQAMHLYKTIEASGMESGALFLNMGIAAVQLDSMGLAKYYFLKASHFPETKIEAEDALEYVNSQFSRKSAILPKLPWDRAVGWMKENLTGFGVFVIGILFIVLSLTLFVLNLFGIMNFKKKWPVGLLLLIGIATVGLAFYVDYIERRYNEGVMVASSARVLQTPREDANLVSIAYEGYDLTIDQKLSNELEDWLYIRLGNGQFGWIKKDRVKVL